MKLVFDLVRERMRSRLGELFAGAAVLAVLAGSSPAYAGLLGSSVVSAYYAYQGPYPYEGSPASFVANGTVQETFCSGCPEGFNLTVSDNQVVYQMLADGHWDTFGPAINSNGLYIANGNLLTFSGVDISGVKLDSASNVPGFTSSDVTFNSDNIAVNWAGLSGISAGDEVILDVTSVTPTATPEPATWVLIAAGLAMAAVGCGRRRLSHTRHQRALLVTKQ